MSQNMQIHTCSTLPLANFPKNNNEKTNKDFKNITFIMIIYGENVALFC